MTLTEFAKEHAFYKGHDELTPDLFKDYLTDTIYHDKLKPSRNKWVQFIFHRTTPYYFELDLNFKSDLNFEIANILIQLAESGYNLPFEQYFNITYDSDFFIDFITGEMIQKFLKYDNLFQLLMRSTFPEFFDIKDIGKIEVLIKSNNIPSVVLEKFLLDDNFNTCFYQNRFNGTEYLIYELYKNKNELSSNLTKAVNNTYNSFNATQVLFVSLINGKRKQFRGINEFDCKELPIDSINDLENMYSEMEVQKIINSVFYQSLLTLKHNMDSKTFVLIYENSKEFRDKGIIEFWSNYKTSVFWKELPNKLLIELYCVFSRNEDKDEFRKVILELKHDKDDYDEFVKLTSIEPKEII